MKLLFLIRGSVLKHVGGSEIQIYNLIQELKKKDCEIHYLYESNKKLKQKYGNVTFHRLPDYTNLFSFLNFLKIGFLIKKINPDIIYQRVKSSYTGLGAFYSKFSSR